MAEISVAEAFVSSSPDDALVGGAFLSSFLEVLFDKMASDEFLNCVKLLKLDDVLLKKLMVAMKSVNTVLDDAEEKQIINPDVKKWLDDLKDAVYGADDVSDEIGVSQRSVFKARSESGAAKVRNFLAKDWRKLIRAKGSTLSGLHRMEERLKGTLDRLETIVKQKEALGLREGTGENPSSKKTPRISLVDEFDVYGRDDDKHAILKLLLSDDADGKKLGVISIVGRGGVGKTTLAQLVYSDSRVQEWFDLKAWVSIVSEKFDVFKIIADILERLSSGGCDDMAPDMLQRTLKERLMGKKCLLVLDDVRSEDRKKWDILLRPFNSVAQGSKIIVTTRDKSVASVMSTFPTHHLRELTDEYCWCLFAKHAFADRDCHAPPELEEIGRLMVKKCKGLPLAVKTLGGLLRCKGNVEEWKQILKSNMWDEDGIVLPSMLIYHYLPSHLKRCFSYCAIFPKNYAFRKEALVRLWMAEELVVSPKGNNGMKEVEEVGEEYFDDLVSRSFFQLSSGYHGSYFVMPALIHDLAEIVSEGFCTRLEDGYSSKITPTIRHLSCMTDDAFNNLHGAQLLRTFLLCERQLHVTVHKLRELRHLRVLSLPQCWYPDKSLYISDWKHLRYLDFSYTSIENLPEMSSSHKLQTLILQGCRGLTELPDSIGCLEHLRYLDLSKTSVKSLPESLGGLNNLRSLILFMCEALFELPTNTGYLINLRCLDIRGTRLHEMPPQMDNLKNLQMLPKFISTGSRIKELDKLHHLRGTLEICNLQHTMDAGDALKANLKDKEYLENLELRWDGDIDDTQQGISVLEQLQPHRSLKSLSIVGYGGERFPDWVGDSSFSNIVSLSLYGCKFCSHLPSLGQLESLKTLIIEDFDRLEAVDMEFYGNCMKPFVSLEELRFEGMPKWHQWISHEGAFPLLQKLYIKRCPNLRRALPSDLPSLTTLEIEGCQQFEVSISGAPLIWRMQLQDDFRDVQIHKLHSGLHRLTVERSLNPCDRLGGIGLRSGLQCLFTPHDLPEEMEGIFGLSTTLEEIEFKNYESLECLQLQLFPRIKSLKIKYCPALKFLVSSEEICHFIPLKSLQIWKCPNLSFFHRPVLFFRNLTQLELWDCSNLKFLPESMHFLLPSLVNLAVSDCPELESFPEGGLPSKLESLQIRSCNKLIAGRMHWDLHRLPSLSHFSFGEYEDVESFPEEMLLPSTLKSLEIWDVQNLKFLDYKELHHLTSLKELYIFGCPNLLSFPKGGLPHPNLTQLLIRSCSKLKALPEHTLFPSLEKLAISDCPEVESFPEGGLPSNLKSLEIGCCDQLIDGRMIWHLQRLPCLSNFEIYTHEDVESFPEQMLLPSSLTSLKISDLYNLKSLDYNGLAHLSSLRELRIWDCPNLLSISEQKLPSSLSFLSIWDCPLLEQRCQQENGIDWPKISHIPVIEINWSNINCARDL